MIGTRLGTYEITAKLGAGGMGEVYRATDTKLGREVAIKVLPAALVHDAERLERFEREARLLAALNHPHIAAIYGVEDSTATKALVLELVPGVTLEERIAQGALAIEEAIAIARQIAEALEAAHEKGVIHRDLKPANIKLTPDGDVKVLDFGLAKALDPASSSGPLASPTLMHSPTLTAAGTQLGVILGTAAYMAPEQARGGAIDKRADIWAFGVVLWEMLAGGRLFQGDTVTDTLAGVLKTEIDWSRLPAATPPNVRRLLERCLTRDRKQRLHDIGDARLELEEAAIGRVAPPAAAAAEKEPFRAKSATLLGIGILIGAVIGGLAFRSLWPRAGGAAAPSSAARLAIVPPANLEFVDTILSPDGRTLAMLLLQRGGGDLQSRPSLYLRPLDRFDPVPVAESEGAVSFGFSTDSRWLYFVAPVAANATQLRMARVPVGGSAAPVTVRLWESGWESWTLLPEGDLLTTSETETKFVRLPADGAPPQPARSFDGGVLSAARFSFTARRLPDGSPLLGLKYYGSRGYQQGVGVLDLATGKVRLLVEDASAGVWLPPGQLLFGRGDALLVASLDATRLTIGGSPRSILGGLRTQGTGEPYPRFQLSENGTLIYPPGGRLGSQRRLAIVDPSGVVTPWSEDSMSFQGRPTIAVGGHRVAHTVMEPNGLLFEIWLSDLEPPALRRLVTVPGVDNSLPVLSRDGSRIAFQRFARAPEDGLYVRSIDGKGEAFRLVAITSAASFGPSDWSADGSRVLATRIIGGKADIVVLTADREGPADPSPLLASGFDEADAAVSPDGQWLAFVSNESGRMEVYAARWLEDGSVGPSIPVSRGLGAAPRWRSDGKAIVYYDQRDHLLSATVTTAPRFTAAPPQPIVDLEKLGLTSAFDLMPDGRLLVVRRGDEEGPIPHLDVVLGFTAGLAAAEKAP